MFDGLIADALKTTLTIIPVQLKSGRRITYQEALQHATRDDLIADLAMRETLELTRQSISKQIEYFAVEHKVNVHRHGLIDLDAINEIVEKRNIFVHHNGIVTTEYFAKFGGSVPPGTRLSLSKETVNDSVDQRVVFILRSGWIRCGAAGGWPARSPLLGVDSSAAWRGFSRS